MLFARIKRTDPEKVYVIVKNTYGTASLTNGQAVMWDYETDCDGVGVTKPSASAGGKAGHMAGIVAETIVAGEYGLVQVYGHHTAIRVRTATNGAVAGAVGVSLVAPASAAFQLDTVRITGTFARGQVVGIMGEAQASYTTKTIKGFIKCL